MGEINPGGSPTLQAIGNVLTCGQMREEGEILRHVANSSLMGRNEDAPRDVRQRAAIEFDHTLLRPTQAGHQFQDRSLAGADGPNKPVTRWSRVAFKCKPVP
jgi:hypothetical protein